MRALALINTLLLVLTACTSCSQNTGIATNEHDSNLPGKETESSSKEPSKETNKQPAQQSATKLDPKGGQEQSNKDGQQSPATYQKTIEEIAASADDTVMDGWFFGQEARMLKSFYRKIPALQKAEFAMAYHDWISKSGEDLVRDFKSYVPYSKRADFAIDWWSSRVERFNKQEKKQQVLWAHESIQDAGELWWRANEKLNPDLVDSPATLAHDEEQKMVSKFMENEGSPGSISDQVWKRTH